MNLNKSALDRYLTTPPEDEPVVLYKCVCFGCDCVFYLEEENGLALCPNCLGDKINFCGNVNYFEE